MFIVIEYAALKPISLYEVTLRKEIEHKSALFYFLYCIVLYL